MCNPDKVAATIQKKIENGKDIVLPKCATGNCACMKKIAEMKEASPARSATEAIAEHTSGLAKNGWGELSTALSSPL